MSASINSVPVTIVINGGAPLGFRLVQGPEESLIVDKVRKNGKADEAGLKGGDVLQSVNGQSCIGLGSPGALSLIDSAGQKLTLQVIRHILDESTPLDDHSATSSRTENITVTRSDRVVEYSSTQQPQQPTSMTNQPHHLQQQQQQQQQQQHSARSSSFQSSSSNSRTLTVSTPAGVQVEQNADESITMTIGFPLSIPMSMPLTTGMPVKARSQPTPAAVPKNNVSSQQTSQVAWKATPPAEEKKKWKPSPVTNPIVARKLPDLNDSDVPSSPGTPGGTKSKKVFIDSAFYDDPQHKYPTMQEQVQLARQVAMSVLAPANSNSRGHKMFVKAKERSVKYTTGPVDEQDAAMADPFTPTDDDPWTKQSLGPMSPNSRGPLGFPTSVMFAPKLPTEKSEEKMNALSSEELERVRLQERKTTHTNVSPQLCFNLADDLRNMKGKGGKLFAKRQAKSESWSVEDGGTATTPGQDEEGTEANPEVMEKLMGGHKRNAPISPSESSATPSDALPVNRLAAMISVPKAAMTPWDAAARFGNVEKAFEHLENVELQKRPKNLMGNLELTLQKKARPQSTVITRSPGEGLFAGAEGSHQAHEDKVKSVGGTMDAAGLARIMTSSLNKPSQSSSASFRQMKFKAPEAAGASAAATDTTMSHKISSVTSEVTSSSQIDRPQASQMSIRLMQT